MPDNGTWASPVADAQYSQGLETGTGGFIGQIYSGLSGYSLCVTLFLLLVAYDQCWLAQVLSRQLQRN